ncbi:hypothetical protein U9M48_001027 [Paspalum notatum var. saurae]|uniref:Protein kinase domain-containing protein n=1 Tax=Paspalum notatum var. saurae TaxID=547442 RepID=A0AAQ3PL86_PASNO
MTTQQQLVLFLLVHHALAFSHIVPVAADAVAGVAPSPSPADAVPGMASPPPLPADAVPPSMASPSPSLPAAPAPAPADCAGKCGGVSIPFPFGTSDNCSWHGDFTLTCNTRFSPPKPFWGNFEVVNISLEDAQMVVYGAVSYTCYNSANTTESDGPVNTSLNVTATPFLISSRGNEFTAIGCSTMALLVGKDDGSYFTGCFTSCVSVDEAAHDGDQCTGLGCCQTPIPTNLTYLEVDWSNSNGTPVNPAWQYSPCSYAFMAQKGWYKFSRHDLAPAEDSDSFAKRFGLGIKATVPLVLDWSITDAGSCSAVDGEASSAEPTTAPACVSDHSRCIVNTTQRPGYLCLCSQGYMGNPYVIGGCRNIDECELGNPCGRVSTCHDTEGSYKCICKFGHVGDGKSAAGCQPIFPYVIAIVAMLVALVLGFSVVMVLRKQKRKKFFDKNGGEILKSVDINIFTEHQLKQITNCYSTPIGEGAFGKVFKGTIAQQQQVAVKRATMKGQDLPKKELFVREICFQFRSRHANLVRLIGCCLETDVPMLVFEFVPNGSLYNLLHCTDRPLPLSTRLDIAVGSAEALSYMHRQVTQDGHSHVHGDVKSANILLDNELLPKVSDFGSTKIMSKSKYVRSVACDRNYTDPVYIITERYTAKSDVYSFGVVLLELITRKTVTYNNNNNNLIVDFKKAYKAQGNGRNMYDRGILTGVDDAHARAQVSECLDRIGTLAVCCLKEDIDDRPTMAEVLDELKNVKLTACGGL